MLACSMPGMLGFDRPVRAAGSEEIPVLLPPRPDFGTTGLIAAVKAGIFDRRKVQVATKPVASEQAAIDGIVTNPTAISLVSAVNFIKARAHGIPVVAFAAGYLESPVAFYVRDDSKIRTPSDFLTKKVGYGTLEEERLIYDTVMLRLRLPRFQIREVRGVDGTAALESGAVDILPAITGKMSVEFAEKNLPVRIIRPSDSGIHILGTVFIANQGGVQRARDRLVTFVKGVIDGWELVYAEPRAPSLANEDLFGIPVSDAIAKLVLEEQRPILRPFGLRIGEFGREQWKATQDAMVDAQLLPRPLDILKSVDFDVVRDAYRQNAP